MTGGRDIETDYAYNCFLLEKYLSVNITPDYPVSKFLVQTEMLKRYFEERRRAEKSASARPSRTFK